MARTGMDDYIRSVNSFIFLRDEPAQADAIFVPGSERPEHVLHAAGLWRQGYAPVIVPSGRFAIGSGGFAGDPAYPTECAWMRELLLRQGVPGSVVLCEDRATYTWENALFSREVTDRAGLTVRRAILCCKAHHARRALFYYEAAFPETEWLVCPAVQKGLGPDDWYLTHEGRQTVLGEIRRLGDQINQVFDDTLTGERNADDHA